MKVQARFMDSIKKEHSYKISGFTFDTDDRDIDRRGTIIVFASYASFDFINENFLFKKIAV